MISDSCKKVSWMVLENQIVLRLVHSIKLLQGNLCSYSSTSLFPLVSVFRALEKSGSLRTGGYLDSVRGKGLNRVAQVLLRRLLPPAILPILKHDRPSNLKSHMQWPNMNLYVEGLVAVPLIQAVCSCLYHLFFSLCFLIVFFTYLFGLISFYIFDGMNVRSGQTDCMTVRHFDVCAVNVELFCYTSYCGNFFFSFWLLGLFRQL